MHRRRFNDSQVERLRDLYAAGVYSAGDIAKRYGIADSAVWSMLKGETYKSAGGRIHVPKGPRYRKLTDEDVRTIRERYEAREQPTRVLAEEYDVSDHHIRMLILGEQRVEAGGPIAERTYAPHTNEELARRIRRFARERYPYQTLAQSWRDARVEWDDCPRKSAFVRIATGSCNTYPDLDEPPVDDPGQTGPMDLDLVRRLRTAVHEGRSPFTELDDPNAWSLRAIKRALRGEPPYHNVTSPEPYTGRVPQQKMTRMTAKQKREIRRRHADGQRTCYIARQVRARYEAVRSLLKREGLV